MGRRETFVQRAIDYCEDDSHGYSWYNDRFGHPDFDCSGLIYQCAVEAGYDVPTSGTRYTGTMLDHFRAAGFYAQPFDGNVWDLDPGDVLLNTGNHTEMYVGDGMFAGAHISELGEVYGEPGDQTGNEVSLCGAYVPSYGWDWVLTPPDDKDSPAPTPEPQPQGVRFRVKSGDEWNAEMVGTHDTGGSNDAYGGQLGVPATLIAVDGHKVRVMTKDSFPEWLPWIEKYDYEDEDKGAAGDGSHILMLEIEGLKPEVHRTSEWDGVIDAVTIR